MPTVYQNFILALSLTLIASLVPATGLHADEQTLAFEGAEGFGRYTAGGRGGRVIKVTNLADSGKGSLRAAIDAEGPRIVMFDVEGIIELQSTLKVNKGHITINGQSAPGMGITLKNFNLTVDASEVIIRYIRVRPGSSMGKELDAISLNSGHNIIVDHCSASWATDETLSVSSAGDVKSVALDNVTVQWSIISESLNKSIHAKGEHGYGSLIRGSYGARYSFHHNLWAHHKARMPRPGNYISIETDPTGPIMDFRNNVFYNWGGNQSGYNADKITRSRYNFINNYYLAGHNSKNANFFNESNPYAEAYFSGNMMNGEMPAAQSDLVTSSVEGHKLAKTAHDVAPVDTDSAADAFKAVLCHAGASKIRDGIDARVIDGILTGTGRMINTVSDVGGWSQASNYEGLTQPECN